MPAVQTQSNNQTVTPFYTLHFPLTDMALEPVSPDVPRKPKVGPDGKLDVRLAKVGKFVHQVWGPFELTEADLVQMAQNFKPGITIDFDHNSRFAHFRDATPRAGALITCESSPRPPDENGTVWLWGTAWFTEDAAEMINTGKYAYASPEISFAAKDESDKDVGVRLDCYAICNRPFWTDLTLGALGFPTLSGASSASGASVQPAKEESKQVQQAAPVQTLEGAGETQPLKSEGLMPDEKKEGLLHYVFSLSADSGLKGEINKTTGKLEVTLPSGETISVMLPDGFRLVPENEENEMEMGAAKDTDMAAGAAVPAKEEDTAAMAGAGAGCEDETMKASAGGAPVEKADKAAMAALSAFNQELKAFRHEVAELRKETTTAKAEAIFTDKGVRPNFRKTLLTTAIEKGMPAMMAQLTELGDAALVDTAEYGHAVQGKALPKQVTLAQKAQKVFDDMERAGKTYTEAYDYLRVNDKPALVAYLEASSSQ
jgi:hypothetical protein